MSNFFKQFKNGEVFPWERDFTQEMLNVALPIVIQSLFMALMHIIDNVMIGRLGEVELAAVTQANRVTFLFQLAVFGLASGTSTYVAQYWGKRDLKGIHSVMGLSLCLSVVAALCFVIPCVLFPRAIMSLLLTDELALDVAVSYLPVVAVGYLATAVVQCFAAVLKSTEQAKLPMFADIVGLGTNTFLNYCLIFGNFGFPRLGAQGGAIATTFALFLTLAIIVIASYRMRFATAARLSALIPRSLAFAKSYLAITLPAILNEGLWALGMVMYSVVYGRMGTAAVAAVSIFTTVQQVALSVARGLTSACAVMTGKRIGAGDEPAAFRTAKRMIYAALPVSLFAGLLLVLLSGPLVSLFNVSEKIARDARILVYIAAGAFWINQLGALLVVGVLRAGGDVRMSLYLDAGTTWLIGVPMVALGGLVLGLDIAQVFLLAQAECVVKVLLGLWRYKSGKWIHNLVR